MGAHSILVVAGETSGEGHAAGVIQVLKKRLSKHQIQFFGTGGSAMAAQGTELLLDVRELAAIGLREAFANLRSYVGAYQRLIREAESRGTKVAILVDFPDFNLRLARRLHRAGITVCYFIAPQLWAWRSSRARALKRYSDLVLVILPFEEPFLRKFGVQAHYVGNPLSSLSNSGVLERSAQKISDPASTVALLPGSRTKEIEKILPIQLDAAGYLARRHPVDFWVLHAPDIDAALLQKILEKWFAESGQKLRIEIRKGRVETLLPKVDCAIVKSGTSTLEATVLGVPFVMVYRLSWVSWLLAKGLVTVDCFCLANILAGRKIVPEFVQYDARGPAIGEAVLRLLKSSDERIRMQSDLKDAASKLGRSNTYEEAARQIEPLVVEQYDLRV